MVITQSYRLCGIIRIMAKRVASEWWVLDEDGSVFRKFFDKETAEHWVGLRPEFTLKQHKLPKPKRTTYEELEALVGNALF